MATRSAHPRIAACSLRVVPGAEKQRLIPAGTFDAPRGAMMGAGPWILTAAGAAEIIRRHASRSTDIVVDYEHQALLTDTNGQKVVASGWIDPRSLEWRPDVAEPGLYGAVKWTAAAQGHVDADEIRYLSPVFAYNPDTGEVTDLINVALTVQPGIDDPILAALSARQLTPSHHHQETPVNETLKKLLVALGLPADTSEDSALTAAAALKAKADTADTQIAALKAASPDPAKYVPVETMTELRNEVAALTARITGSEAGQLIDAALADGRLLPAQKTWAEDLGKSNLAALKQYCETAAPIAALKSTQTGGTAPAGTDKNAPTDGELAVCKALGLSHEEFAKAKINKE